MTDPAAILEEEWGLLARALAMPARQMIVVETLETAQMAEVERRLGKLAGARPITRLMADPAVDAPDGLWQQARHCIQPETDPDAPPLLLVEIDAPPPADAQARQRLTEFWRGMNQLREHWHDLPAQTVFLLSPAAYQHLGLNAGHLKRWISLHARLWPGAQDLEVLERPGRPELAQAVQPRIEADDSRDRLERQRLDILARQYQQAEKGGASGPSLLRPYLLPLIQGHLALGDLEGARAWRRRIAPDWGLDACDRADLAKLDESLGTDATMPSAFDVFLSHNSKDKPAVRELARALREHGLSVWLDEDELRPGLNWQKQLEGGIRQSRSVAVLIGKDGLGPWQAEEVQDALIHAVNDGRPVIPVLLPDAPRQPGLPPFLSTRTWVDLRPAVTEANLGRLIWGITGKKPVFPPVKVVKPKPKQERIYSDGLTGMEFVLIEGGLFQMGSPNSEKGRSSDERQHLVQVKSLYLGKYPVTNAQFRRFEPEHDSGRGFNGEDQPVVEVCWLGATAYAEWLSQGTGDSYRLPTEAEWEYAARAGTTGRYSFGDDERELGDYAWYKGNSGGVIHPVGQKRPNPWGLYDMHGNVWEWTCSAYDNNYAGGEMRCISKNDAYVFRSARGGSWFFEPGFVRSASRFRLATSFQGFNYGFRLARIIPP